MNPKRLRASLGVESLAARFGLRIRSHRILEMDLRLAEVERPDDMVREVYPDAVTEHGDAPVWMITWPAALGLAEHLVESRAAAGKRVLELGCGTAAPGLAAERSGAEVLCTDYDPLALRLAAYNARLNGCTALETHRLDWYNPDLKGRFELVLGSEIVYFEKSFAPLLDVLICATAPGGRVLLADQGRPQMAAFLAMCSSAAFRLETTVRVVHLPEHSLPIRVVELTLQDRRPR